MSKATKQSWWKALAVAGGVLCLCGFSSSAHAQGPLSGIFQKGPEPAPKGAPADPFTLTDRGEPNAFTTLMDVRPRFPGPALPRHLRHNWDSLRPGLIYPTVTPAVAAEFPNPARESNEPVSPWTVRDEGMPNAFNELVDPRPRPFMNLLHGQRRLVTEMLEPMPQVIPPWVLSFRGEYLLWRPTPGPSSAALLTTTANPNLADIGQIGNPRTVVLVNKGTDTFEYGWINGLRFGMTVASKILPPIEVSGFTFTNTTSPFSGGSLTNPTQTLSFPFQDIQPAAIIPGTNGVGVETAVVISLPIGSPVGALGGVVDINSRMDLWGIEALGLIPLGCSDSLKVDFVIGYRHLQMNEEVRLSTVSGGQVGNVIFQNLQLPQGLFQVSSLDSFRVTNSFDGAQLGGRGVLTAGRFSLYGEGKVGLGMSRHNLAINGSSSLTYLLDPAQTTTVPGGVFAQGTNIGALSTSVFNVTSELSASLSYQLHPNIRAFAGYNFLYWASVGRPGDFISNRIDSRQIPAGVFTPGVAYTGPTAPTTITRREFVAHGLFLGIEIGF